MSEQGASGAAGAPGGEGVPGTMGTAGTPPEAGTGGVGGTGGTGGTGRQGERGPTGEPGSVKGEKGEKGEKGTRGTAGSTGASHTAVVVQQTKLTRWQRTALVVGAVALVLIAVVAQVRGLVSDHRNAQQHRDDQAQVEQLRVRTKAAETRRNLTSDRAYAERQQERALTCDQFDRLNQFVATITRLSLASPAVTPEERAALAPFVNPPPRPAECAPAPSGSAP